MIRPVMDNDLPAIVEMVQHERQKKTSDIEEQVKNCITWVWDDGLVQGYAAVSKVHTSSEGPAVSTCIYTAPSCDREEVGTKLWEQVKTHINTLDVVRLYTNYNKDSENSRALFARHGFEIWFRLHSMRYDGPDFGPSTLKPIPYEDNMFEDFVRLTNDGFRELRRQSNIEPADCYPPGFEEEQERKDKLDDKDNIFLFYEGGKAIGYTQLGPDYIDTITVDESYRGRGLGRKITELSVTLLRQRGVTTVSLGVLDVNTVARNLYESLGFQFVETQEFARAKISQ